MKKENYQFTILLTILLIFVPTIVMANLVWPSLYIAEGMHSWYIIALGLVIEFIFIKIYAKQSLKKSALISICINAVSSVIGIIAIPLSGIFTEFVMAYNTFHISHWIADCILAVLCNVIFEGLTLKLVFKLGFKKNLWWLAAANLITVVISMISLLPQMP